MFLKIVTLIAVSLFAVRAAVITSRLKTTDVDSTLSFVIAQLEGLLHKISANNETIAALTAQLAACNASLANSQNSSTSASTSTTTSNTTTITPAEASGQWYVFYSDGN